MGMVHDTTSAYFASSNRYMEKSLASLKILMYKHNMEKKGTLEETVDLLNNTPVTAEGLSPARLYYGRPVRNPRLSMIVADDMEESVVAQKKAEEREWSKQVQNDKLSIFRRKPLDLVRGDTVRMQSVKSGRWDCLGKIVEVRDSGRSTYVQCEDIGSIYLINQIFLKADTVTEEDTSMVDSAVDSATVIKSALKKAGRTSCSSDRWSVRIVSFKLVCGHRDEVKEVDCGGLV